MQVVLFGLDGIFFLITLLGVIVVMSDAASVLG
jgi:hypothetical protein